MKKTGPFKFFFLVFFWSALSLAQSLWQQNPPSDLKEVFNYLTGMSQIMPEIIPTAVRYDQDLLGFLEANRKLYEKLRRDPKYLALLEQRDPELLSLSIQTEESSPVSSKRLSPAFLRQWSIAASEILKSFPAESGDFGTALEVQLKQTLSSPVLGRSQGILSGLIQLLPKEIRAQVFQATSSQKLLQILDSHLPLDLSPTSFQGQNFGWTEVPLLKETVLSRLQTILEVERRALLLSQIFIALKDSQNSVLIERTTALRKIQTVADNGTLADLGGQGLDAFSNLREILKRNGIDGKVEKILQTLNAKEIKGHTEEVMSSGHFRKRLSLVEVPPIVGILRGFIGSDCATKFSMPYPNSPLERVFFIFDKEERVKGYASGTVVQSDSGPALYLHSINGPRLTKEDVLLVREALSQSHDLLNVKRLVLPNPHQLKYLANSDIVFDTTLQQSSTHYTAITYLDTALRSDDFKPLSQGGYDNPEYNRTGAYMAGPSMKLKIDRERNPMMAFTSRPAKREVIFDFLVSYFALGKEKELEAIAPRADQLAGLDPSKMKALFRVLQNEESRPLEEYLSNVEAHIRDLGIDFSENDIELRWPFFLSGALRGPFPHDPVRASQLTRWLKWALQAGNQTFLFQIIRRVSQPEIIKEVRNLLQKQEWQTDPKFLNMVKGIGDEKVNYENLRQALLQRQGQGQSSGVRCEVVHRK